MIYLLEDDESIRKFVIYALNQTGFEAEGFGLPSQFKAAVEKKAPKLVLLDIMLPEEDGISVLSWLRKRNDTAQIPVIFLTAKSSEYDKVTGLDNGADDYITKPFGTMELVSRIKALLRRTSKSAEEYSAGELYVCPSKHIVKVKDEEVALTTRDRLLEEIWGYDYDGESRTVDVHIKTLRTKLKSCGELVETVRGIGYKIA